MVKKPEIVGQILKALEEGRFEVEPIHGQPRMHLRGVTTEDIQEVARTASQFFRQKNGRFRIVGRDLDGAKLTVIVEIESGYLVITVYYSEELKA